MIALAFAISATIGIGLFLFSRLRTASYSLTSSAIIVVLSLMQLCTLPFTFRFLALLMIVVACLTAMALLHFAQHQNVRSVIALGGTLALVQTINPLASLIAAALIPVIVHKPQGSGAFANRTALLVLLLFIPASSAAILFYVVRLSHIAVFTWLSAPYGLSLSRVALPNEVFRIHELLRVLWLPVIGWPIWLSAAFDRTRSAALIAAVGVATVAVSGGAALFDGQPLAIAVPALAALSVFALCEWRAFEKREILAVVTIASSTILASLGVGASA